VLNANAGWPENIKKIDVATKMPSKTGNLNLIPKLRLRSPGDNFTCIQVVGI